METPLINGGSVCRIAAAAAVFVGGKVYRNASVIGADAT
jgi:hypothetical protein